MWSPRRLPSGVRVAPAVSNASIPATVVDVSGQGRATFPVPSLAALWAGAAPEGFASPHLELMGRPWAPKHERVHLGTMRSVIDARWQYIEQDGQSPEFYDWAADPQERLNLVGRLELLGIIDDLKKRIR
jgi:arylsulfatase A-like enzyme